ncbi:MAG: SPASM domain-containing protein, partial [Pseudomonadota bacterium]
KEQGLDPSLYHVEALITTTPASFARGKEIVDTYVDLGCTALFLRPVDPFGFADKTKKQISVTPHEYLEFYRKAVDYMLKLNAGGVQILERYAAIFLTKIIGGGDPNFLDIRNPCGAGIGQVAYNYDGKVFTCDEGRMLHEMGDSSFEIGSVQSNKLHDIIGHETVRALAIASNLDAQPGCVSCAYQPFCGVCPVISYKTQGSIFGRMLDNYLCAVFMGIQDYLFTRLGEGDEKVLETFKAWTTVRDRDHHIHVCSVPSS